MSEEMTRKEVIWQLKGLLLGELRTTAKERKALEYAISSLETDEAYNLMYEDPEFCENCIDRELFIRDLYCKAQGETSINIHWLEGYIKQFPSVLPKAKWIPVTTRKPKLEERVLIFTEDRKIKIAYRDNIPWTENQYEYVVISMLGYKFSYEEDKVLAWMPLPKPYKGRK